MNRISILPAALLLASSGALAQFRCDCTSIVDTCSAEVVIRGASIEVTADRPQCARVDYFVDGQPFVSLAVDGRASESWIARTAEPRVIVQSCQVCRENAPGATTLVPRAADAAAADDADRGGRLEPLIEVAPAYPSGALARRVSGHVDVELTVTPDGGVANARVIAAEPTGLFEQAALAAASRYRFPSDPQREPQTLTRRIEFRAPAAAPAPAPRAANAAAVPATGPRNQCVREEAAYNFGDTIEVGLLNACDEPLLVYSCAEGTGRHASRWSCTDSERQAALLAPAGGGGAPAGEGGYARVERLFVTRAPNSQYWWVACRETDDACRAGAQQWVRSVDGQPAAVDPRDRASVSVARSY